MVTASAMDWPVFRHYLFNPVIMRGVVTTFELTAYCEVLAIVTGALVAAALMGANPVWQIVGHAYQWVFRSIPELAQLLFWFNLALVFPHFSLGLPFGPSLYATSMNTVMTPWVAAILGIGLHEGAYLAEVFRSGITTVGRGQTEAARVLGIPRRKIALRIVLPQAMRVIAPNAGSRLIGTFKLTSLASILAVAELLYTVQAIYSANFETIPLLMVATVWYMSGVAVLRGLQHLLERRFGSRRSPTAAAIAVGFGDEEPG